MKILFCNGWRAAPGGPKSQYLIERGHEVVECMQSDDNFPEAVRFAQEAFDRLRPDVVVGLSRGGAVAMNIESGSTRLVLIAPAWKKWGQVRDAKPGTIILHARADDIVPYELSEELIQNSGLPASALVEVGVDHWQNHPATLQAMLAACEAHGSQ